MYHGLNGGVLQEGYNAFYQGKLLTDNPYKKDSLLWEAWDLGWRRADFNG